jgi:hypothetical protein
VRTGDDSEGRAWIDVRAQLATVLVSAAGMSVNLLSDTVGWWGVAAAFVAWAVIAAATWLRRLPSQAPLAR